jgi:uncharacterized protein
MQKTSTKIRIFSLAALGTCTVLSLVGLYFAAQISTSYSMDQFVPKKHPLLKVDWESKKVFQILDSSPHILLLSFDSGGGSRWYQPANLERLNTLSSKIQKLSNVKSVISLGNISSAYESKGEILVGTLGDLQKQGFSTKNIMTNPLYTPNLMSKDGFHSAVFVTPSLAANVEQHKHLMEKIRIMARETFPYAKVKIGGPAAIRTQLLDLLSQEILIFIFLALACAVVVLKIMFHGFFVVLQACFILLIANFLALGVMGYAGIPFNILSSTLPIIVTVSSLGIFTHLLVRMSETAHLPWHERIQSLRELVREISVTIVLTGLSTVVGFACLIPSDVQVISDYGLAVSMGVFVSSLTTMLLVPSLYVWVKWPMPRKFLAEPKRFAYFVTRKAAWINPVMLALTVTFATVGISLSWTAKLMDDLPTGHSTRLSTDLISNKLGGVSTLDLIVGSDKIKDGWKKPANIRKLQALAEELRARRDIGSILTLSDFLTTTGKQAVPKSREAIAELQFLYGMSGESPLKHFVSSDDKWTRVAIRLPDLPADRNQALIGSLKNRFEKQFPGMQVRTSGTAAIVPRMNKELSKHLMWGFFEALFWIVLVLAIYFRSLRWALVAVVPNLTPPAVLLGVMALFDVPVKPGIAIVFAISLGIAFDNTIYVLGRLKHFLKLNPKTTTLPVYTLMKKETMPCFVSSMCLFAGFSIFLFSVFPVNKIFGLFVLLSILAGLLGDLVWLPAILKRYPWLLLEKTRHATMERTFAFQFREHAVRFSPYILLVGLAMVAFHNSYAASPAASPAAAPAGNGSTDVQTILKAVEEKAAPPSERVQMKMVIIDSNGSKQERELTILRKNDGQPRALVRLNKPSDLKGLSLLTVSADGKEDQYLYLPSDKKSRRILGSNKKGKFLGSEIAYEDLSISTYREFENKIVKDDGKIVQIESKAKPDSESSYGRVTTWINKVDSRIEKVDYYDKDGKLLKRAQFKGYTKVGGKFWRAKQVLVHNVQDNRKTQLIVKKVNLTKIKDDEVSLAALEE